MHQVNVVLVLDGERIWELPILLQEVELAPRQNAVKVNSLLAPQLGVDR